MAANERNMGPEAIRRIFLDVFMKISKRETPPQLELVFYPFAGLNHTIRIRDRVVRVRISDTMKDAPPSVYQALAHILISRLLKRRVPADAELQYRTWAYQPDVLERADTARRERGRKYFSSPAGRHHDLNKLWDHLNSQYFNAELSKPALGWSMRRTKRILGHHDSVHDAIVISRTLDSGSVPRYVVEYVLYHEMLHIKHSTNYKDGRRSFHPPAFRRDEQRYRYYDLATYWLDHTLQRR